MAEKSLNLQIAIADDGGYILNGYSFNAAPIPVQRLTDLLGGSPVVDGALDEGEEGWQAGRVRQQTRVADDYTSMRSEVDLIVTTIFGP